MAVLIIISFAIVPSFSAQPNPQNSANTQILTYYDSGGTYHFIVFAWNEFGQSLSGVGVQANLSLSSFNGFGQTTASSESVYVGTKVVTNTSGIAQFVIKAPVDENYSIVVSVIQSNGFSQIEGFGEPYLNYASMKNGTGSPQIFPPGDVVGLNGGSTFEPVIDSTNSTRMDIQVLWAGPNGSVPSNYSVYYKFLNYTGALDPSLYNESNMQLLGTMSSYRQIFAPPKFEANLLKNAFIVLGLFYPNGTSAAVVPDFVSQFYPPAQVITPGQGNSIVVSFFEGVFGLIIPLVAIIGSYNSYGKDRVSGVLESVLAQPVSRKGLSISRYISSFVAMAIAISISIAVLDLIARSFTGAFIDGNLMLYSTLAFFAELAAFIGIMMFLSHLTKSSGALIGIGIGLFMVIDVFWSLILTLAASAVNIQYGSAGFYQLGVIGSFANPAQLVALVITYFTHNFNMVGFAGFFLFITPSQYSITILSIAAAGILWVAAPLAIFLYLSIKRD